MKTHKIYLIILFVFCCVKGQAQGIGGLFNQGSTQTKYLLEQIAALQVYEQYLKSGYKIVGNGTAVISGIKTGDLNMHTAFIDSLSTVSARVRSYSKVSATVKMQQQLISDHDKAFAQVNKEAQLTTRELIAYNSAYEDILKGCTSDMDELKMVLTSGKLKMSDDARIGLIDKLYDRMNSNYKRSASLNRQFLQLSAQRARERKDNKNLRSLYGG